MAGKEARQSGAYDSDILAAIDAAIGDGVDVINFSISSADNPAAPVQLAFLAAASAGIFVAASAGNSGPGASTVQSTSPWVTTVGAHTIAPYYGTVTLGNGRAYAGISTSVDEPVGPARLVNGTAVAAAGQTAANATACAPDSLDPAKTAGTIVVCARGVVERTVKSAEVERAGGIGMVLVNLTANTLDADLHSVPTVHVDPPASTAITVYAATAGATATLTEGNETSTDLIYPQIATFSARGPSVGTGGDTLKPDLVAPGVSILGAVAPPSNDGQDFGFLSGTSESAPQVAGLAALWFGAGVRPTWSPMAIKSALMTTAADLVDGSGRRVSDPFAQGAGRVVPDRMFAPGLVYLAGQRDWCGYLEGLGMDTSTRGQGDRPERLQLAVDRHRAAGGHADRHPPGHRGDGRTLPGRCQCPGLRRRRQSVGARLQPRRADPHLPGHVHPHDGGLRPGGYRVPDVEGHAQFRADPARRHPAGPRGSGPGRRLRIVGSGADRRHPRRVRNVHSQRCGSRHRRPEGCRSAGSR